MGREIGLATLGLGVEPDSAADSHAHTTHIMNMPCTSYAATVSWLGEVRHHSASGLTRAELSFAASLAPEARRVGRAARVRLSAGSKTRAGA